MFAVAVIDGGVSPEYFWDRMDMVEYSYLVNRLNSKKIEDFEPFRMLGYIISTALGSDIKYEEFLNLSKTKNGEVSDDGRTPEEIELAKQKLIEIGLKHKSI